MAKVKVIERSRGNFGGLGAMVQELNRSEQELKQEGMNPTTSSKNENDSSQTTIKPYSINIETTPEGVTLFNEIYGQILYKTQNISYVHKKDIFKILLNEYNKYLKENGIYLVAPEGFNIIRKTGRRPAGGEKFVKSATKRAILFGTYQDETSQIFNNIVYSIVMKERMKNMHEYSKNYFFIEILKYSKDNIENIISSYKI